MDKELGTIVEDEYLDDCSVDDIKESLPGHQPRYLVINNQHRYLAINNQPRYFVINNQPNYLVINNHSQILGNK